LDNSLRFYAAFLVDKPLDLASRFAQGESIRNFKERGTKQRLTDRLLVERLAEHYPWIIELYERTSSYIHLSGMHLFNAMGKQKENPKAGIVISEKMHLLPSKIVLKRFIQCSGFHKLYCGY